MKYHVQVDGKVIRANLSSKKAMEYFELLREVMPSHEVSILVSKGVECFG